MLDDTPGILSPTKTETPQPEASPVAENTPASSYNCNLDSLLTEMQEPREDVNQGKTQVEDGPSYSENKPAVVKEKLTAEEKGLREKKARWEANFLSKNNDTLQALICSIIAQEEDLDEYRASKEEISDLANEIYEMRKDAKDHLPPWVGIVVGLLLMYGPQYKKAVADRRLNKALVEKAAREEAEKITALRMLRDTQERLAAMEEKNAKPAETTKEQESTVKELVKFEETK